MSDEQIKIYLIEAIFAFHVLVFLAFPLGFLIPSSLWPSRIDIHFFYCLTLFTLFYIWGLLWTIRFRDGVYATCILDTLMQRIRGFSIWDPRNYQHSFTEELFSRLKISGISKKSVPGLLLVCIILSGLLFLLKREGIVLW